MRVFMATMAGAACGAIWYASTSVAAQPQTLQAAITIGETMTWPSNRTLRATVAP